MLCTLFVSEVLAEKRSTITASHERQTHYLWWCKCAVPPSTKPPTTSLKIDKFLRPFTHKAVKELLANTGAVQAMWMDQIKTHCYVMVCHNPESVCLSWGFLSRCFRSIFLSAACLSHMAFLLGKQCQVGFWQLPCCIFFVNWIQSYLYLWSHHVLVEVLLMLAQSFWSFD
jgi:hypothetical protein